VQLRLQTIGERKVDGFPTWSSFLARRMALAMRTCITTQERQANLSQKLARTANLLRTRVEVEVEQQNQCRALHLCRQVATASKHRTVDKYPDPSVSAGVNVRPAPQTEGRVGTWKPFADWEIVITDGTTTRLAVDVLEEARAYWYRFIPKLGLIID
jgi:predicted RNA-binding protein YlxR (DUF448 family)